LVTSTRKSRKLARRNMDDDNNISHRNSLHMCDLLPMTANQKLVFDAFHSGKNLFLSGLAGTGKTFISVALALQDILRGTCTQERLMIMRSAVPTRDMGFLPGSVKEKIRVYEAPYHAICSEIFNRGDAYDILKSKGLIQFSTTSHIRGLTIMDAIVVIDEIQNLSAHEANSLITRMGVNTRVIICGDLRQNDLVYTREQSGMGDIIKIISRMKSFAMVEFEREDIVRSAFVKEYLIARDDLEREKKIMPLGA
jgi:phosphate starvation-inducible PhoH-like protein